HQVKRRRGGFKLENLLLGAVFEKAEVRLRQADKSATGIAIDNAHVECDELRIDANDVAFTYFLSILDRRGYPGRDCWCVWSEPRFWAWLWRLGDNFSVRS